MQEEKVLGIIPIPTACQEQKTKESKPRDYFGKSPHERASLKFLIIFWLSDTINIL